MTYQQVLENARTCIGPYCKACNDCNGKVCRNTMPGPGAKGEGTGFIRNAEKWREICVNMDTICENAPVDTSYTLFGRTFEIPAFAAPIGAMRSRTALLPMSPSSSTMLTRPASSSATSATPSLCWGSSFTIT